MRTPTTLSLVAVLLGCVATSAQSRSQPATLDRIEPVPFTAVHVEDSFWSPRLATNRDVTVRYEFEQ